MSEWQVTGMQDGETAEGWPENSAAEGTRYKPDNPGLIPVTHMAEGGNQLSCPQTWAL